MDKRNSPIIICGAARSGTTFIWQLLNEHPDIVLSDEFFIYKTPSMMKWFDEMREAFGSLTARGDWKPRKAAIMRSLWYYTSQPARAEAGLISRRWGNKTPGSELYIDFYEDVLEESPPHYIYCMRDPIRVFLSTRNMAWGKGGNIQGQVKRYIRSIRAMEDFREQAPERMKIFQIDKVASDLESRVDVVSEILGYVGEEITDEIMPFIRSWKKVLSTEQVRRKDLGNVLSSLPEDDVEYLGKHKDLQRIAHDYGYSE